MRKRFSTSTTTALLLAGLLTSLGAAGQPGRVVESQAAVPGQTTVGAGAAPNSDALQLLFEQNRNLQNEIQALRAMVEEQGFQIRRLQQESLDRYTNTDARLSNLEQSVAGGAVAVSGSANATGGPGAAAGSANAAGGPALQPPAPIDAPLNNQPGGGAATVSGATPQRGISAGPVVTPRRGINERPSTTPPDTGRTGAGIASPSPDAASTSIATTVPTSRGTITPRPALEPAVLTEQQLYQMAYDSAINSQFERAIAEFDQYLSLYPSGRFTTNAHYWKGQSYLYLSRYGEAVEAYNIILERYPQDAKVPDALYGLGVAFEGMGNTQRARQIMQDIRRRYPNTGVANLADTRLLSLP